MRLKAVFKPADHPKGAHDPEVVELFSKLMPGVKDPAFDLPHAGLAITALNPKVALQMAQLSRVLALETGWAKRHDLRELAIQTLNLHYKSDFSLQARQPYAEAAGITDRLTAALPYWRTTTLFNDEQRLVVEYTHAVTSGEVPEELFARVVAAFGETGAMEFTALVGFWSCWAMINNAVGPTF